MRKQDQIKVLIALVDGLAIKYLEKVQITGVMTDLLQSYKKPSYKKG